MSESSYLPPQPPPGLPVNNPHLPIGIPRIVTVFGIMHLVFAGIGMVSAVSGLFMAFAGNPSMKMQGNAADAMVQAQQTMMDKVKTVEITGECLSILVGVVMIIAGIKLVKGRRDGLGWSNKYAYLSLLEKLAKLVIAFTVVIPATREMMRDMMNGSTSVPSGMNTFMEISLVGGVIGSILVAAIYPILTLVLLNRRGLREWFAERGR